VAGAEALPFADGTVGCELHEQCCGRCA
jgi:hypothetical protein